VEGEGKRKGKEALLETQESSRSHRKISGREKEEEKKKKRKRKRKRDGPAFPFSNLEEETTGGREKRKRDRGDRIQFHLEMGWE